MLHIEHNNIDEICNVDALKNALNEKEDILDELSIEGGETVSRAALDGGTAAVSLGIGTEVLLWYTQFLQIGNN